jgi:hypothetical protein
MTWSSITFRALISKFSFDATSLKLFSQKVFISSLPNMSCLYFGHTKKPFKVYTQVIALFSAKSARGRFNLCLKDRGILYPLTPTQSILERKMICASVIRIFYSSCAPIGVQDSYNRFVYPACELLIEVCSKKDLKR